jgi:hypothetical protein
MGGDRDGNYKSKAVRAGEEDDADFAGKAGKWGDRIDGAASGGCKPPE